MGCDAGMTDTAAILRTQDAEVGYGGKVVVQGVDIALVPGHIVTLIGPNGSGKSTVLKSVIRQLDLVGGAIYLEGRDMRQLGPHAIATKLAAMMTDRAAPELATCEDVVAAGRYPYTGRFGVLSDEDRLRVRESLARVGALDLAVRDFSLVSDGQRQRVLLARALCQEPRVLVLDEPTSYLDVRYKLELAGILRSLVREEGLAVLMSLHELDLAQRVSDTVVCVNEGRIERVGAPGDVFTEPYISHLYGLPRGCYTPLSGTFEMVSATGSPRVMVVGGAGSGVEAYRTLQRRGIPFAAGVLHANDVETPVARALAVQVVEERPFEAIGEEAYRLACNLADTCGQVVCSLPEDGFGTMNARNRDIVERARRAGALVSLREVR